MILLLLIGLMFNTIRNTLNGPFLLHYYLHHGAICNILVQALAPQLYLYKYCDSFKHLLWLQRWHSLKWQLTIFFSKSSWWILNELEYQQYWSIDEFQFLWKTQNQLVLFHRNKPSIFTVYFSLLHNYYKRLLDDGCTNWNRHKNYIFWKCIFDTSAKIWQSGQKEFSHAWIHAKEQLDIYLNTTLSSWVLMLSAPDLLHNIDPSDQIHWKKKQIKIQAPQIFNRPSKVLCLQCTFSLLLITTQIPCLKAVELTTIKSHLSTWQ